MRILYDQFLPTYLSLSLSMLTHTQLFLSDTDCAFSKLLGWTAGERTGRYALIIDNGKIVYAEKEPGREVTVSGAEAVLSKL